MRVEFNLITQRETALDSPMTWYGALAVLAGLVPLIALGMSIARLGAIRAGIADIQAVQDRLARLEKKRWTRPRVELLARRMDEASSVTRRCALRPQRVIHAIAALVPDGVRLTRLELGTPEQHDKSLSGIALTREALSQFMANLSGPGRATIASFELRSEQRRAAPGSSDAGGGGGESAGGTTAGNVAGQAGGPAAGPAAGSAGGAPGSAAAGGLGAGLRFVMSFQLSGGGS